jgi:hypothetical protein
MPFALIFISGGAILALELLASRIMTPYFGVSLFIWTGILSITLISLAFGYWWGGRLAGGPAPSPQHWRCGFRSCRRWRASPSQPAGLSLRLPSAGAWSLVGGDSPPA